MALVDQRQLRRSFPLRIVAVTVLAMLAGPACADGGSGKGSSDPGVSHVHGLGIDPADDVLYAATHHGVFRIPEEGRAKRVADRYQDTMGFTVAGAHRFLASGHPALDDDALRVEGKPPLLGLVESKDAAETWRPVSLLGDADFHALVVAHGRVYGHDATGGRFMVSEDGRAWEVRSAVQLTSFAVAPSNADAIVAATDAAVLRSGDGGRSWEPIPSAPRMLWLSWAARLWGVGPDGRLFESDDGTAWTQRGRVPGGAPEALLARGGELYVATASGLHQSGDNGRTWRLRYRDPG